MEGTETENRERLHAARDVILQRNWQRLYDGTWYNPISNEWIASYQNLVIVCTGGSISGGVAPPGETPDEVVIKLLARMGVKQ
jgi:hypothetical protein